MSMRSLRVLNKEREGIHSFLPAALSRPSAHRRGYAGTADLQVPRSATFFFIVIICGSHAGARAASSRHLRLQPVAALANSILAAPSTFPSSQRPFIPIAFPKFASQSRRIRRLRPPEEAYAVTRPIPALSHGEELWSCGCRIRSGACGHRLLAGAKSTMRHMPCAPRCLRYSRASSRGIPLV